MGNGDPVSQQYFHDTMNGTKKEILDAVKEVNGHVQDTRVEMREVHTKFDSQEKRIDAQDTRMGEQDKKIDNQKNWNRGLATVEALIATGLAYLGIRQQ